MTDNIKLVAGYFAKLEAEGYHGTVEVTMQGGRVKFTREIRSRQDFEMALDCWDLLSIETQTEIRERFKDNAKFQALIKGKR
jgi:hypothetical protein